MSIGEIEQRLVALEETVAHLRTQLASPCESHPALPTDQLLNGVEYPTVLAKRQREVVRLRGKIRRMRRGRQDLALSQTEWSSMIPEQNDA